MRSERNPAVNRSIIKSHFGLWMFWHKANDTFPLTDRSNHWSSDTVRRGPAWKRSWLLTTRKSTTLPSAVPGEARTCSRVSVTLLWISKWNHSTIYLPSLFYLKLFLIFSNFKSSFLMELFLKALMVLSECLISVTWNTPLSSTKTISINRCCVWRGTNRTRIIWQRLRLTQPR